MKDFKKDLIENLPALKKHALILSNKHLGNSEKDEEDLLQETVKKALLKQHTFDGRYLLAWLKRLMTNYAIDESRHESIKSKVKGEKGNETKRKNRKISFGRESTYSDKDGKDVGPSFENNPEIDISSENSKDWGDSTTPENEKEDNKERKNALYNAINKMDKKCREILLLFSSGWEYEEISERLSIPKPTVGVNILRCRKKLGEMVQKFN
jgi:RNA polymerase sigma factor (sigma-70 family)|tara:strand:+ start:217 stop:849 length:633 start_codon:yes stop_codon:yes gene_type:complete